MTRGAFALHDPPAPSLSRLQIRATRPQGSPLNACGIKANQKQSKLRDAILKQPQSDLFRDLCEVYQAHLDDTASLDHVPTICRTHERINRDYKIKLTEKSFLKVVGLAHEEMTRVASILLRRKVIEVMDLWSIRSWRERIRAIDEGERDEAFRELRAAYEGEAGTKLLGDEQFMTALKMAARMRNKRTGKDDDHDAAEDNDVDHDRF
jgi:hypothetical protein